MTTNRLANIIECILFANGDAVSHHEIIERINVDFEVFEEALNLLRQKYSGESGIIFIEFKDKLQFSTNPMYINEVSDVLNPIREKELTNTVLETLAIIAYKQPITRTEIEEIRGVDCTYGIQTLLKVELIEVVGRKDAIGKPLLFGTTDSFLKRFSLKNIDFLPDYEEVMRLIADKELNNIGKDLFDIHKSYNKNDVNASKENAEKNQENNYENANSLQLDETEGKVEEIDNGYNSVAPINNEKDSKIQEDKNSKIQEYVGSKISNHKENNNYEMSFEDDIPDFLEGENIVKV